MTIEVPLWLQGGTYPARLDRALLANLLTEGILGAASFAVTQRGAGANMSVDVAAGVAVITGDDQANQGHYLVTSTTTVNVVIGAAPGSNSRYDLIVLRVNDPNAGGAAGNNATLAVVAGTAAASPVEPALPASALRIARVTVASGTVSITNAMITNQRVASASVHDLIAAGTILAADLADDSVTAAKLADGAVTQVKLAAGAVGTVALADGAITNVKLVANTIEGTKIAGGAIGTFHLAGGSVTVDKIADTHVTEAKLAAAVLSSAWTDLTFAGGWAAPDGAGMRVKYKKIGNVVFVSGGAKRTGTTATSPPIGTLPAGFRPPGQVNVIGAYQQVADATGTVWGYDGSTYNAVSGQTYWINLTFPAA